MFILLPVLLLFLTAVALALLAWRRPNYTYYWLWAAGGAFLAWVSVWVLRSQLPSTIRLALWRSDGLLPTPPGLLADAVSWPFALALATMCLAVVFTDVGRAAETSWMIWAGDLGITALGILAVLAGNPITLVMVWTLIDFLEMLILIRQVDDEQTRRSVMVFFSTNMLGIMLVLWAMMVSQGVGPPLTFAHIPSGAVVFLIVGIGMRMGILPLQVVFLQDVHQQRGQGTLLRLIPPATSLVLLVRVAYAEVAQTWEWILLVFAVLAAGYGSIVWARAKDELQGRIYWIVGIPGLAFAAALRSKPEATLAWSVALLYPGALLFLASIRERRLWPIGLLSVYSLLSLPLSPTLRGGGMHSPFHPFSIFLLIAQAILVLGFIRHILRETDPLVGVERWVQLIYPLGLTLLPATHFIAGNWLSPDLGVTASSPIWPGLVVVGIVVTVIVLGWRGVKPPERVGAIFDQVFSLRWFYDFFEWAYNAVGQALTFITALLEGEGGVLWAFLLVALLVSIITQLGSGLGG
jgi:hypothetical protein